MQVEVVDELMGNGKTTTVLRYIEQQHIQKGAKWVYATEYLDELQTRTQEDPEAAHLWRFPTAEDGRKLDSLTSLVSAERGLIGVTHNLLKKMATDPEAMTLMQRKGYRLYIDETISLIDVCKVKSGDFMQWLSSGLIEIDTEDYGRVSLTDKDSGTQGLPSSFDWFASACRSGCIYASIRQSEKGSPFVSVTEHIPDSVLRWFDRVILTTYLFEGSVMDSYLRLHDIKAAASNIEVPSRVSKEKVRSLLKIRDEYNHHFKDCSMSASWYEEAAKGKHNKDIERLCLTIRNAADKYGGKEDHSLLGYTHPTDLLPPAGRKKRTVVKPARYKPQVFIKSLDGNTTNVIDKQQSCFIPCSARASNDYAHKKVMIHAFNRYPNQVIRCYLEDTGHPIDIDRFALSEMIQWIWRSCIRKGEEVTVLVLSNRMNKILSNWIAE